MRKKGEIVRLRHKKTGEERSLKILLADSIQGYMPKEITVWTSEESHHNWHRPEDWHYWTGLEWKQMK
jgi:hypothetical protein